VSDGIRRPPKIQIGRDPLGIGDVYAVGEQFDVRGGTMESKPAITGDNRRSQKRRRRRPSKAWDEFALALAKGETVREAAARLGIGETQAYSKANDVKFGRRVDDLRGRFMSEAVGRLAADASKAADRLGKLVDSRNPKIARAAACDLLKLAREMRTTEELQRQLNELRDELEELRHDHGKPAATSPETPGEPGAA